MSDMPSKIKVWGNNYPLVAATHLADDGLYGLDGETYYRGDLVDQLIEAVINRDKLEPVAFGVRCAEAIAQLQGVSEDG